MVSSCTPLFSYTRNPYHPHHRFSGLADSEDTIKKAKYPIAFKTKL